MGPIATLDILNNRKVLASVGIRTLDRPVRNIVTTLFDPFVHGRKLSIIFTDKYITFLLDSIDPSSAFRHFIFTFLIEIMSRTAVLTPEYSGVFGFIR